MKTNAFEAMCELAAREEWCWNLACTTCGHITFRRGFRALTQAIHPRDSGWYVYKSEDGGDHRISRWQMNEGEQGVLVYIAATANLRNIKAIADSPRPSGVDYYSFPNWLGYLGLVLAHTEAVERQLGLLSKLWLPQLGELSRRTPDQLRQIFGDGHHLRWSDLATFER